MKVKWHLLLPPFALVFQLAPPVFIWVVAAITYRTPALMTETWVWPVSLVGLAFWATASLLLGGAGAYLLLTRSRLRTAIPLIAVCCIPSFIGGSVYLLSVLIFLTIL